MFCHECGKPYSKHPHYPGWVSGKSEGDPEVGPARRCCPDGHETLDEVVESKIYEESNQTIGEYLTQTSEGYRDDPNDLDVPQAVMDAAKVLMGFREAHDAHWDKIFADLTQGMTEEEIG